MGLQLEDSKKQDEAATFKKKKLEAKLFIVMRGMFRYNESMTEL